MHIRMHACMILPSLPRQEAADVYDGGHPKKANTGVGGAVAALTAISATESQCAVVTCELCKVRPVRKIGVE